MAQSKALRFGIAFAVLLSTAAHGEQAMRSRSGQFLVSGLSATPRFLSYSLTNSVDYVRLDPAALAVSCERIKETLLAELQLADKWRGTIHVRTFAVHQDNEPVRFTSVRYKDGWAYGVDLPEWITRARLTATIVQAVLTEIANRRSPERGAELPAWLLEGLTAYLLAVDSDRLVLEPATRTLKRQPFEESLVPVRQALRSRTALTLDQLSWPRDEPDALYTHCAHLFVHELLQLRGGRACMAQMIARLSENYNWQTTFLAAFNPHFSRLVDVDKWWALTVAHVTGRDPMSLWPLDQALTFLDQLLTTPVQVRMKDSGLPGTTEVKLQSILAEWDDKRLEPFLGQKIGHLQALRLRSPAEALEIIDGYMIALQNRLRKRANNSETIRKLNSLDAQLLKLSRPPK